MRPTFPDRTSPNPSRKIAPKSNEFTDFQKSWILSSFFPTFWLPCWNLISLAAVLLLELEKLYESCNVLLPWGRSPFQGWAPGRAAKIQRARRWRYFSGKFGHCSASCPDTSLSTDFSKTHRWTWDLHSWIGLDLTNPEKLVRSETNSQILRNLHFRKPFTLIFDWHVETQFPLPLYYS